MKRSLPSYCYRKGKRGYVYFIRRGCKPVRIHAQPGTEEFAAEYALAMRGRAQTVPKGRTFTDLIRHYKSGPKYAKLAPRTKQDYDKVLAFIADRIGDIDPAKVQRRHVIAWQAENAKALRFANYLVQIVRILMERAIDLGWCADNPAKGVAMLKGPKKEWNGWPADLIEAYRNAATGQALLVFELCLGTGARIGDVLRMHWNHISDGGISVTQGKTGETNWIPLTPRLRALLDATPKTGLTILTNDAGKPLPYKTAQGLVMRIRKQIGGEGKPIHGLRKSATSELSAAGCSDELIMAVTGHKTVAMVRHYAGPALQKARATEAQGKRK